jgi:ATP phosphoribosyltransferase regulatory subunit HisZ
MVRLSHAAIVRAVLAAAGMSADEQSSSYDRLLDGDMTVVDEVEARLPRLNASLRMLFEIEGQGSGYLANLHGPLTAAVPALGIAFDELASVVAALEARGVTPRIKAVLARSFEYYSGLVMRIDAGDRRVVTGGRYDHLVGLVGDAAVPASGFALYLTPLIELLPARARAAGERRIVVRPDGDDPALIAETYATADTLRSAGLHVESVEGMHSAPTQRLTCRATAPRFVLESPDGRQEFAAIADVVRALGSEPRA